MHLHPLGQTGLSVSPVGFGSFKIGRNTGIKYPQGYNCPSEPDVERLLNGLIDLGINYFDTAPAYGTAESLIGRYVSRNTRDAVVSTKVGETHHRGESRYDFSRKGILASLASSRRSLGRETLDVVFIHAHRHDVEILTETDVVETLLDAKRRGEIRACGFSAQSVAAARQALDWVDVLMLEYHSTNRRFESVIDEAAQRNIGVVVKKGLASGHLPADTAVPFALRPRGVSALLIGSLSLDHMRQNVAFAIS